MWTQYTRQCSRRKFLGGVALSRGRRGSLVCLLGRSPRSRRPRRRVLGCIRRPVSATAPNTSPKSCCTAKGSPRSTTSRSPGRHLQRDLPPPVFQGIDITTTFAPTAIIQVGIKSRSSCSVACTSAVTSCLGRNGSAPSVTSRGRLSPPPSTGAHHLFVATMARHVGLNPHTDIHWVLRQPAESIQLLAAGQIDALVGFPPLPQKSVPRRSGT